MPLSTLWTRHLVGRSFDRGRVRSVLIYRVGTIGDTVVAIPAIVALRRAFPEARFHLMSATGDGKVWAADVLEPFGWFESMVTYQRDDLLSPTAAVALIRSIRQLHPDLVVHLASDKNSTMRILRDVLFFKIAGAGAVIAATSRKVTAFGHLRRSPASYPSEVDRLLDTVRPVTGSDDAPEFEFPIGESTRRRLDTLLAAGFDGATAPLVGLCPGSKQQAKCWPIDRYGEIGRRLIDHGARIVTVGGPDEHAIAKRIGAEWPRDRWLNLAGQLSIVESAELLRRCLMYVGNDTGPMHLSAMFATPCVAIFAAREPEASWLPYGGGHTVLRRQVPCQNCYLTECYAERVRCLREIRVEDVWTACARTLEARWTGRSL